MALGVEEKHEIHHCESLEEQNRLNARTISALAVNEDEPQTPYQLGWRTIAALLALSMANVCAALSNTVSQILLRLEII